MQENRIHMLGVCRSVGSISWLLLNPSRGTRYTHTVFTPPTYKLLPKDQTCSGRSIREQLLYQLVCPPLSQSLSQWLTRAFSQGFTPFFLPETQQYNFPQKFLQNKKHFLSQCLPPMSFSCIKQRLVCLDFRFVCQSFCLFIVCLIVTIFLCLSFMLFPFLSKTFLPWNITYIISILAQIIILLRGRLALTTIIISSTANLQPDRDFLYTALFPHSYCQGWTRAHQGVLELEARVARFPGRVSTTTHFLGAHD